LRILFSLILSIAAVVVQPVFAAGQTVAVLPSEGDLKANELKFLTDKAQEIAVGVLPQNSFDVFPQEVVIKRLGGADNYVKECRESSCIAELGKKANVGDVISISIVSSTTGYVEFDNAIKDMVATWKWKTIKCGNTTPTIPFNFTE